MSDQGLLGFACGGVAPGMPLNSPLQGQESLVRSAPVSHLGLVERRRWRGRLCGATRLATHSSPVGHGPAPTWTPRAVRQFHAISLMLIQALDDFIFLSF
jgi:hypothetical protein